MVYSRLWPESPGLPSKIPITRIPIVVALVPKAGTLSNHIFLSGTRGNAYRRGVILSLSMPGSIGGGGEPWEPNESIGIAVLMRTQDTPAAPTTNDEHGAPSGVIPLRSGTQVF